MSKRRSAAASGRVAEHVRAGIASVPAPTCRQQPHPHLADAGIRVVRKTPESLENRAAASTGIGPPPKQDDGPGYRSHLTHRVEYLRACQFRVKPGPCCVLALRVPRRVGPPPFPPLCGGPTAPASDLADAGRPVEQTAPSGERRPVGRGAPHSQHQVICRPQQHAMLPPACGPAAARARALSSPDGHRGRRPDALMGSVMCCVPSC